MRKNPWFMLLVVGGVFLFLGAIVIGMATMNFGSDRPKIKAKNSLAVIELSGPIFESKKWLKKFKEIAEDKKILGVLLRVESPGGAVGPSEEIYMTLEQFRKKTGKPIVVYAPSLLASGAYYISMAADSIYTTRGALVGSIGVIMSFANLEGLYGLAKVSRYSITSGKMKDAGAEYRAMNEEERGYFQELINETYEQFLGTVAKGRKLETEIVRPFADGRVFNGEMAVRNKLVDAIGTERDALDHLADLAKIGSDYEVYEPPKYKPSLIEKLFFQNEDEEEEMSVTEQVNQAIDRILMREYVGKPLFMMPSYMGQAH